MKRVEKYNTYIKTGDVLYVYHYIYRMAISAGAFFYFFYQTYITAITFMRS